MKLEELLTASTKIGRYANNIQQSDLSFSLSLAIEVYSAMECILGKMRVKLITNWVLGIVHATIYVYVSERESERLACE